MSTTCKLVAIEKVDSACTQALREFVIAVGTRPFLFRPEGLPERLVLLDKLDAILGFFDFSDLNSGPNSRPVSLARALQAKLESANESLYESARSEIVLNGNSHTLASWLLNLERRRDVRGSYPGLSFDLLDEIVSGVLQLREPEELELPRSPEMACYQPTPVRHILALASNLSDKDILIDLGSGLGHVPLLISMLLGIPTLGIERQPTYVATAQECATRLNLKRTEFVTEDARLADLSSGTVFYLFAPFSGLILTDVLDRLRMESMEKQIRICSLGPCTHVLADQTWLAPSTVPDAGRITIFKSRRACSPAVTGGAHNSEAEM